MPHILLSDGPYMAEIGVSRRVQVDSAPDFLSSSGPPAGGSISPKNKQQTKRKTVNVRKEFPETWLWTEEMVK